MVSILLLCHSFYSSRQFSCRQRQTNLFRPAHWLKWPSEWSGMTTPLPLLLHLQQNLSQCRSWMDTAAANKIKRVKFKCPTHTDNNHFRQCLMLPIKPLVYFMSCSCEKGHLTNSCTYCHSYLYQALCLFFIFKHFLHYILQRFVQVFIFSH